mgnify:CR=1 FL=1
MSVRVGEREGYEGEAAGAAGTERLVLELKDKLHFVGGGHAPVPAPRSTSPSSAFTGVLATVHGALVQMGFKPYEAETALQKLQPQADGKPAEELLREALASLA